MATEIIGIGTAFTYEVVAIIIIRVVFYIGQGVIKRQSFVV